ncbi:phage tail tape measure protein [Vibrio sp. V37_P2S8PM304]|uniref:phage tail tape measure protein n=1 Tax=Vibrio sp. V37_P2S8PM304 TaxID=1938688 RepID=UPI0013733F53|nr:phage tail tape measure protein [Vibrio sp. V37_P2S8PM304]NAX31991.1 phage tail tape measure protein [Vibrio sp. V37_P2S8PM304]
MGDTTSKLSFVMEMVDKITTPITKVTDQTKKSASAIEATQKQISKLSQTSADLDTFKRLKRDSIETSRALEFQNKKVAELARKMREAEKPARMMTTEFNRAKREAQALAQQHGRESQKLTELRGKLEQVGISTKNLRQATSQVERHTERLNDSLKEQQRQLEAVAQREKKLTSLRDRNRQILGSATMDTAKVGAATYALAKLSESYGHVASAQGTIQSLGIGSEGIEAITQAAKDFSNQWSGTTQAEFIAASYDIKSGISSLSDVAVGEYTRIAAMTAGATKSTTEQMTSLFASGYGIYRKQFDRFGAQSMEGWESLSQAERDMKFGEYFSAGIASSVKAFKTNGSEMSASISNLGATATAANVSFAEQLSILGQLQATMSGSEAATKYKAFLNTAGGAAEKLGLNFHDTNNQLLSMPEILQELRREYGDTLDDIESQELKKAFGSDEAMALIKLLYPEIDTLKQNIGGMNEALEGGMNTANDMAKAILLGPNESTERMNQRISNLTATLGKVFAPMMMFVTDTIGGAAMVLADLAEKFPFLTQMIGGAIMTLIALKTVMIGVKLAQVAWNFLMMVGIQRMTLMAVVQRTLAVATRVMTVAQWALNAAFRASPIGLVITAVMALIGLAAFLVDDWSPVIAFFSSMWDSVSAVFWSAVDGIKAAISSAWETITALFSFTPLGMVVEGWEPLVGFFGGLWERILGMFQQGMEWISSTIGKVKGWWDSIFGDDEKVTKAVEISRNVQNSGGPSLNSSSGYLGGVAPARTGIAASHTAPASYTSSYQIAIEQKPGESGDDVARRVRDELDRRDRENARRGRANMND